MAPDRILYVDHESKWVHLLRQILTGAGYDVTVTHKGERAIQLLADECLSLVITEVCAVAYPRGATAHRQLAISKSTAESRGEYYRIFKLRFEGGMVSQVELEQARSDYELALATIPTIERQIGQQENAPAIAGLARCNKPDIDRKDVWQFKNFLITDGD